MAARSDKVQLEEMVESEQIILKAFDDIGVERPDDVLLLTDDEIENKMGLKPNHIKKLKAVIAEYKKWKVWSLRTRLHTDAAASSKDVGGKKAQEKDKPKK